MEKHTTYFYRPVKNMLYGGVLIYDLDNKYLQILHKIYSIFLLAIFGYGYIITELIHVYQHFNDMEELTLTMCYLIAHFIGIGKVIVLSYKRKSIGAFITSLEHGEFLPNLERGGAEEKHIIDYAVARTNNQAKVFGITVVAMISSRIIQVSMHTQQMVYDEMSNMTFFIPVFPYPSTLPFPINSDKAMGYIFEFVYETFSIILFGWYLGNSDTIITGLMIHVTAQFKIVTNSLLNVMEKAERISNIYPLEILKNVKTLEVFGEKDIDSWLTKKLNENLLICVKDCIRHHYSILDLLEKMENTFNQLLLIQFLGDLLTMCVGLYQTSLLPLTNPSFVSMSSFTLAMTFQLLIYCWNGNELSLYSVRVADAAYNCRWLNASRDVKLSLLLIMERAQRLSYLTAGKFSKLSLETFTAILRGSVSYFMVLRKVNEDQINQNI